MKSVAVCRYAVREILRLRGSREQWLNHCPAIVDSREGRRWVGCHEVACQYYLAIEESLELYAMTVLKNWTQTGVAYGPKGWSPGAFPKKPAADAGPAGEKERPDSRKGGEG